MSGEQTRATDRALVATTSSLVEFLRDVALARRRRILDVSEYDTVLWLDDLPAEVSVEVNAGPGEVLFSVPRLRPEAPPEPPAALTNWLDRDAMRDSSSDSPVLKEKGPAWVVVEQPDGTKGIQPKVVKRDEAPDVGRAFANWLPQWQAWAVRDRRMAPFRRWYTALAAAANLVSQQEDQYEIVLGTGLLAWRSATGAQVRNHILTTRLIAVVDTESDTVRVVVDPEASTRAQDRELLDGEPGYDPARVENIHDRIREEAVESPLVDCEALVKQWAERALDDETPYVSQWAPVTRVEANGEVRLSPAVVVRRRERASLVGYYDAMLAALRGPTAQAPLGLAQLVTAMEADERLAWLAADGAASGEMLGADPLFPLPANPEQMRIMERLRTNNGVVVQGPPGTGKTHTIANLMSALLAEGQRVLVTSQKAQALRVLREKLPPEVAKLCVSITDLDRGGSAELESSVKAMSNRYAGFDASAHADEVARMEQRRAELVARVDHLTDLVRALREAELTVHPTVAPGFDGTLGAIAGRLHDQAPRYSWMPVPVPGGSDAAAPLSAAEAAELARLLATQTPERVDRPNQRPVDVSAYPVGDEVRAMVAAEESAHAAAQHGSTDVSRHLEGVHADVLTTVQSTVDKARTALVRLGLDPDAGQWPTTDWAGRAIAEGLAGQNTTLWRQLTASAAQLEPATRALETIGFREVVIGKAAPGTATARLALVVPLRDHLAEGGKLRGAFKSSAQRDAEPVLENSTVDGLPSTTLEQVELVTAALQAQSCVENLGRGWTLASAPLPPVADEAVQQSVARIVDRYTRLDLVNQFLAAVASARDQLTRAQAFLPLGSRTEWQDFVTALDAVRLRVGAEEASAALTVLSERLSLDARGAAAPPELAAAAAAVQDRDPQAYAAAINGLGDVAREQAEQAACDALLARLRDRTPGPGRPPGGDRERPGVAGPAVHMGRRLGLGPGRHVLPRPAPARPRAAARGRAGRHHRPAAPGDRAARRGPGLGPLPAPHDRAPGPGPALVRAAHAPGRQGHRPVRRQVPHAGPRGDAGGAGRRPGLDHAAGRGAGHPRAGAGLVRRGDRRRGQPGQPGGPVPAVAGAAGHRGRRRQAVRAVPGPVG